MNWLAIWALCAVSYVMSSPLNMQNHMHKVKGDPEVEAKVSLSLQGYKNLLPFFSGAKEKKRQDLQLEVYRNGRYRLGQQGVKFRVKIKKKKTQVEVSQLGFERGTSCGESTIRATLRGKTQYAWSRDDILSFQELAERVHEGLVTQSRGVRKSLSEQDTMIREIVKAIDHPLLDAASVRDLYVTSTVHKSKRHRKFEIIEDGQIIEFKLIETTDLDAQGEPQVRYQLEAELVDDSDWSDTRLAEFVCHYFALAEKPRAFFSFAVGGGNEHTLMLLRRVVQ